MGGRRGRPEEDSLATTATTMEAKATTLVTIMVTTMAATTLGTAMATATTPATTTTTEGAASETAIVPQTSSAVTSDLATSAPGPTTMADQQQINNIKNTKTNDNVAH